MVDDMQREAFENLIVDMGFRIDRLSVDSDFYYDPQVSLLWNGWCAHIRHVREQEDKAEPVAWQRRIKADQGNWLRWEYFSGADEYENDRSKFPDRVGRWQCEYRALKTDPPAERVRAPDWRHIANELADATCNGIQWLKNVRDGISVADEAIAEMTENYHRIQALTAAPEAKI